jgi:hypothetical protein
MDNEHLSIALTSSLSAQATAVSESILSVAPVNVQPAISAPRNNALTVPEELRSTLLEAYAQTEAVKTQLGELELQYLAHKDALVRKHSEAANKLQSMYELSAKAAGADIASRRWSINLSTMVVEPSP